MVPSAFVLLEELPFNSNGKVDRMALPLPGQSAKASHGKKEAAVRDSLEGELVKIWETVLGVHPVGIQDNFFDLGGHSLLAARLLSRIDNATGVRLPLSSIFQAPTIEQMAAVLSQHMQSRRGSSLVPIQPHGENVPVFMVPPAGNTGIVFEEIAHRIGTDQPFYSFNPRGFDDRLTPQTSVEEIAEHYLAEMCQFHPNGPYIIGGNCLGGIIALEMAHQLLAQNKEVALLVILDSGIPGSGPTWTNSVNKPLIKSLGAYLRRTVHYIFQEKLDKKIRAIFRDVVMQYNSLFDENARSMMKVYRAHVKAQGNYHALPFTGPSICIQSEESFLFSEKRKRWSELLNGDVEFVAIPGTTHLTLFSKEHGIQAIADHMRQRLDELNSDSK